jgi:predicted Zn finger-like uncharacterized protein
MDVRCERCRAQYVFDDDQVTASGLTVQCTNCGHLFKVKKKELVVTVPVRPGDVEGTPLPATAVAPRPAGARTSSPGMPAVAPPADPPQAPAEAERAREWRVRQASGNTFTFRELTTLQKWIIEQKVGRDDEISLSGDQWKRLGNIAELASFFQVVEAAERSRAQPALTPLPGLTPLPVPVYGVAVQAPAIFPPPPPTGFPPPPSFATPAAYAPLPPPAAAEPRLSAPAVLPPPVHEVDLGMDDEPPRPRGGALRREGALGWVVAAVALAAAGGGVWLAVPLVSAPPPQPPPPAPAPRPAEEVAVPITIEVKPAALQAAPPPEPKAAPAPEPAARPGASTPPEPAASPDPRPAKPAPPKGPKASLARAKALLANGDAKVALELYGRVASEDPGNVEAQAGRGLCYLDLENWAPAEASFQAALRLDPDHADALLGLAETYRGQGKRSEAVASYERYLQRYPGGDEAEVAKNALAELRK